jgi:hypothetical protein
MFETTDVATGRYVASAGQLEPGEFPDSNNGVFNRNNRNGLRDITDGSSTTLMVGERSRNVADATWVGAVPTWQVCTNSKWAVQECGSASTLVYGLPRRRSFGCQADRQVACFGHAMPASPAIPAP